MHGIALLVTTLAAAAPAPKPSHPAVLVVGMAGDDADRATSVAAMVAESVIRRFEDRFSLIQPFDPEGEKKREDAYHDARKYLAASDQLYNELDLVSSAASAERAATLLEQANLALHFADLVRARLLQIRALVGNSEEKAARAAADRLLAINLRTDFDPKQFPPEFLAWVNQHRDEVRAKSDMAIEIRAQVPARVYVDGIYRGIAPTEVKKLAPGEHYVTLIAPGYELRQYKTHAGVSETAEMRPGERLAELNQHLAILRAAMSDDVRRDKELREMGHVFGASQVLYLSLSRQSKTAFSALALRIAASDGHYLAYVEEALPDRGEAGLMAAAGQFAERALATDAPREDGKPVTRAGQGGGLNFTLDRRTGGFISTGAGGVLVLTGVVFGILALNQAAAFRATPQTDPSAPGIAGTGQAFALVADISYLLGAVGLGGGGYLFYSAGAQSPAPARESAESLGPPEAAPETPTPPERPALASPARTPPAGTGAASPPPATSRKSTSPAGSPQTPPPAATKPAEKPKPPPEQKKKEEDFDDLRDDR